MKVYGDLDIFTEDINSWISELSSSLPTSWVRKLKTEEKAKQIGSNKAFCFEYHGERFPKAGLTIFEKKKGHWYIPNIVPLEQGTLSYGEYNGILEDFYSSCVEQYKKSNMLSSEISPFSLSEIDVLGENGAALLKAFSTEANKSTGSSHPCDQERWFKFLLAVRDMDIPTNYLERILIEQGWSENNADKLAMEYEFAHDLISFMQEDENQH